MIGPCIPTRYSGTLRESPSATITTGATLVNAAHPKDAEIRAAIFGLKNQIAVLEKELYG